MGTDDTDHERARSGERPKGFPSSRLVTCLAGAIALLVAFGGEARAEPLGTAAGPTAAARLATVDAGAREWPADATGAATARGSRLAPTPALAEASAPVAWESRSGAANPPSGHMTTAVSPLRPRVAPASPAGARVSVPGPAWRQPAAVEPRPWSGQAAVRPEPQARAERADTDSRRSTVHTQPARVQRGRTAPQHKPAAHRLEPRTGSGRGPAAKAAAPESRAPKAALATRGTRKPSGPAHGATAAPNTETAGVSRPKPTARPKPAAAAGGRPETHPAGAPSTVTATPEPGPVADADVFGAAFEGGGGVRAADGAGRLDTTVADVTPGRSSSDGPVMETLAEALIDAGTGGGRRAELTSSVPALLLPGGSSPAGLRAPATTPFGRRAAAPWHEPGAGDTAPPIAARSTALRPVPAARPPDEGGARAPARPPDAPGSPLGDPSEAPAASAAGSSGGSAAALLPLVVAAGLLPIFAAGVVGLAVASAGCRPAAFAVALERPG